MTKAKKKQLRIGVGYRVTFMSKPRFDFEKAKVVTEYVKEVKGDKVFIHGWNYDVDGLRRKDIRTSVNMKNTAAYKLIMKVIGETELAGFTKTIEHDYDGYYNEGMPVLVLEKKEDTKIHVCFNGPTKYCGAKVYDEKIGWNGHTSFKVDKGWLTFDRRGVEDSFYSSEYDDDTPQDNLNEQVERIVVRRKFHDTAETIPEIGFSVSPERKAEITKKLKHGGYESFMPSGFGTGYTLYGRRMKTSDFGCKVASAALKKFFEVKTLYIESFDAD